jgi:type IV pilus assembly protein PilV
MRRQRGVGLIEVAIALLIMSVGTLGLAGLQIAAKRMGYEAIQRTEAAALAMDLLERIRANRSALPAYDVAALGAAAGSPLPAPLTYCDRQRCSSVELAFWDLWQWERALEGAAVAGSAGGLLRPGACIRVNEQLVTLRINWQGFRPLDAAPAGPGCGAAPAAGRAADRNWLQMTSWVAGQ